jgi:WD40 repeat protein
MSTSCPFITDMAWSPDGHMLAVAHGMGVWLWRGGFGGTPTQRIDADAPIRSLTFTPDSRWLATGYADTTVQIFDAVTLTQRIMLGGHQGAVNAVAFSPDSRVLASASSDATVRLALLTETMALAPYAPVTLNGHTAEVTGVLFTGDGHVLSAGWDSPARLWNMNTAGISLAAAFAHGDWVRGLAGHAGRGLAAAPSRDGSVYLWSLREHREVARLAVYEKGVDAAAFSPDGALLAAGARDGMLHVWSVDGLLETPLNATPLFTTAAHSKPVLALAFASNGRFLATAGGDNAVSLWAVVPMTGEPASG